jgi:site-specific DNA recombinase
MKTVILARVSSVEQELGLSIDAQVSNMVAYCKRNGFEDCEVFKIIESSTRGARKKFYNMIDYIKKQKGKVVLIADAVDRVQRGFTDSLPLDNLRKSGKLELHFLREGIVLNDDSRGADLIRWDWAVVSAKSYVLNISDNVKRTYDLKIKNGEWIGRAPVGYLNERNDMDKSNVVIDKARAYLVEQAFELYASGTYSVKGIELFLVEEGLVNPLSGRFLGKSSVHSMLNNPFYYGMMRIKGELYSHKYEPIIDKELFDRCQAVFSGHDKQNFKYAAKPFPLRGLIKCAHCGCSVSFDKKKGKYVYGKCTQHKGKCGAVRVTEASLIIQLEAVFKKISIPEEVLVDLKKELEKLVDSKEIYRKSSVAALRCEHDRIQKKINVLLDMRLSESITQSEYDKTATQLKEQQFLIDKKLKQHTTADKEFGITVSSLLDLASRSYELFQSSEVDKKRQLLNLVFSNLSLEGKKLCCKPKEPFAAIIAANSRSEWLPRLAAIRTWFQKRGVVSFC